jgi:hypothetical protein
MPLKAIAYTVQSFQCLLTGILNELWSLQELIYNWESSVKLQQTLIHFENPFHNDWLCKFPQPNTTYHCGCMDSNLQCEDQGTDVLFPQGQRVTLYSNYCSCIDKEILIGGREL